MTFNWRSGADGHTHLGLIAEEVAEAIPEVVVAEGDANEPLGMNYSELVPVLINAVQEQQGMLAERDERIAALEARNAEFESRLAALEARNGDERLTFSLGNARK